MVDRTAALTAASRVWVDGAYIDGHVVEPCTGAEGKVIGVPLGASSYQKLAFSTLSMSGACVHKSSCVVLTADDLTRRADADSATKDKQVLATLGTIVVKITRCVVFSRYAAPIGIAAGVVPEHLKPGKLTVHERAKKLGGHHATYAVILMSFALPLAHCRTILLL